MASPTTASAPAWLIGYNLMSGCLWTFVILNVLVTHAAFGFSLPTTFALTYRWTTGVQCLALVEVFNAAMGIVRSPLLTTSMQVASRLLVVLGVWTVYPHSPLNSSVAYFTLHFAWAVTEVVRYYYYATHLMPTSVVPPWLVWARYNFFLVLYPLGISSECVMLYGAVKTALAHNNVYYAFFLSMCLLAYIPGTIVLFSHMLTQRKKFMKSNSNTKAKKVE